MKNQLTFATLILLCCMSATMLFAEAPSSPGGPKSNPAQLATTTAHPSTKLTYKTIGAPKNTYGYDIFADGTLMIHQSSIPAIPGFEGFKTKEDATKVALLVIEKIKKGEMPPTTSIAEMKTLGVIK